MPRRRYCPKMGCTIVPGWDRPSLVCRDSEPPSVFLPARSKFEISRTPVDSTGGRVNPDGRTAVLSAWRLMMGFCAPAATPTCSSLISLRFVIPQSRSKIFIVKIMSGLWAHIAFNIASSESKNAAMKKKTFKIEVFLRLNDMRFLKYGL